MSAHSGIRAVTLAGKAIYVAVGPVAILRWLDQVAGDDNLEHGDVCFALALQSFVNGKEGFTFATQEVIGLKARVSERTASRRLRNLISRGHVLQQRRRWQPAVMYLALQDTPANGVSQDDQDTPADGVSESAENPSRHANHAPQDTPAKCIKTRQTGIASDCKESDYDHLTYRLNLPTITYAGAAAPLGAPLAPASESVLADRELADTAGSIAPSKARSPSTDRLPPPEELSFPSEDDEIVVDDVPLVGVPPPIDSAGLDRLVAEEATKPQPDGWLDYVSGVL